VATAGAGASGRPFQLGGGRLVRADGGGRPVPGPPVGLPRAVQRAGQGQVDGTAFGERRGPVDGRADQRVPELDAGAFGADQPTGFGRAERMRVP